MGVLQGLSYEQLETSYKNQVNWFFWIAGLTIINSIIFQLKLNLAFVIGLGFTKILDIASELSNGQSIGAFFLLINLLIVGVFVLIGIFSRKKKFIALLIGIILYSIDAIVVLILQDYISFGFHLFALFFLVVACQNYNEQKRRKIKSESGEVEISKLESDKNIKTMNGANIGINYNIDENKITRENSQLRNNCSMTLSITIDGKTETKNFFDEIDLSIEFKKEFTKDGSKDLELICYKSGDSIIAKAIKYSKDEKVLEIEEEFLIGKN